ncbi:toll/interleukin-1 receptor domain-containing protein [Streptomyces phaeochromogenes]
MAGIFINYRTGDGERAPELVDERLVHVFGKKKVFRDRRSMRPGTDFPDYLRWELENCTVLLALIGPRWLDIRDTKTGARRIDVPKDYVHDEIATAIALNKIVIPVLLNADLPSAAELPPAIVGLNNRQALHMREGYAHHDLPILTEELRQYVPEKKRDKKRDGGTGLVIDMGSGNRFDRNAIGTDPVYNEGAEPREADGNGGRP